MTGRERGGHKNEGVKNSAVQGSADGWMRKYGIEHE